MLAVHGDALGVAHRLWAGLKNAANIQIIIENAGTVVVDVGDWDAQ